MSVASNYSTTLVSFSKLPCLFIILPFLFLMLLTPAILVAFYAYTINKLFPAGHRVIAVSGAPCYPCYRGAQAASMNDKYRGEGSSECKIASTSSFAMAAMTNTEEEDRISDLPDGILASIVSRLPVEEALRTSVLSPWWRYVWTFASLSIEDYHLCNYRRDWCSDRGISVSCGDGRMRHRCWVVQAIDGILARHRGPIRSCYLTWLPCARCDCSGQGNPINFDKWNETLAERGIQTLDLVCCFGLKCVRINSPSLRMLALSYANMAEMEALSPALNPSPYHLSLEDCPYRIEPGCSRFDRENC